MLRRNTAVVVNQMLYRFSGAQAAFKHDCGEHSSFLARWRQALYVAMPVSLEQGVESDHSESPVVVVWFSGP